MLWVKSEGRELHSISFVRGQTEDRCDLVEPPSWSWEYDLSDPNRTGGVCVVSGRLPAEFADLFELVGEGSGAEGEPPCLRGERHYHVYSDYAGPDWPGRKFCRSAAPDEAQSTFDAFDALLDQAVEDCVAQFGDHDLGE